MPAWTVAMSCSSIGSCAVPRIDHAGSENSSPRRLVAVARSGVALLVWVWTAGECRRAAPRTRSRSARATPHRVPVRRPARLSTDCSTHRAAHAERRHGDRQAGGPCERVGECVGERVERDHVRRDDKPATTMPSGDHDRISMLGTRVVLNRNPAPLAAYVVVAVRIEPKTANRGHRRTSRPTAMRWPAGEGPCPAAEWSSGSRAAHSPAAAAIRPVNAVRRTSGGGC